MCGSIKPEAIVDMIEKKTNDFYYIQGRVSPYVFFWKHNSPNT